MKESILIVDRIENNVAVCEDQNGNMIDIKLTQIIDTIVEGDILAFTKEGYKVDRELTNKREEEMKEILKEMLE